jgi:AcrR family transcriptional regulator
VGRPSLQERAPYDVEGVIDIALDLFSAQGYDATSMADLAHAIGIGKSSIYHHIKGKEQILALALARGLDALSGVLDEVAANEGPARDRLRHIIGRAVEVQATHLREVTLLLRLRGNGDVERQGLQQRRELDNRFADLIRRAQKEHSVRRDVAPVILTRLVFGMVNSLTEWYRPDGPVSAQDMADTVLTVLFEGVTVNTRATRLSVS